MNEVLKLWTDGEDMYAAETVDAAAQIRRGMMGADADDMPELELAKEPLTMVMDEVGDNQSETHTHSEWIAIVTNGKPGYVASTNW
jgi:hypothetical protein